MLREFRARKDHKIEAKRPDLLIVDKREKLPHYRLAIPEDGRVRVKEDENVSTNT